MKKLFYLLLLLPLIVGCSSSDSDDEDVPAGDTLVTIDALSVSYPNTKVAYFDAEGLCKLIVDLGDLNGVSEQFTIQSKDIKEILIFSDYGISEAMTANYAYQMGSARKIEQGKLNKFILSPTEFGSPVSKKDPRKYPR